MNGRAVLLVGVLLLGLTACSGRSKPTETKIADQPKGAGTEKGKTTEPSTPTEQAVSRKTLPGLPTVDFAWPEKLELRKREVDAAVSKYHEDPVSACVTFKDILGLEVAPKPEDWLGPKPTEWLRKASQVSLAPAWEILERDFDEAVKRGDLRSAVFSAKVAEKLKDGGLPKAKAALVSLKEKLLADAKGANSIWRIEKVEVERQEGDIHESQGILDFKITPPPGREYVRVNGQATGMSDEPDLPYADKSLSYVDWGFLDPPKQPGQGRRLVNPNQFYVVTPGGEWVAASYSSPSCELLSENRRFSFRKMLYSGAYVDKGVSFPFGVFFALPPDVQSATLVFLGSGPVRLTIPGKGASPTK